MLERENIGKRKNPLLLPKSDQKKISHRNHPPPTKPSLSETFIQLQFPLVCAWLKSVSSRSICPAVLKYRTESLTGLLPLMVQREGYVCIKHNATEAKKYICCVVHNSCPVVMASASFTFQCWLDFVTLSKAIWRRTNTTNRKIATISKRCLFSPNKVQKLETGLRALTLTR